MATNQQIEAMRSLLKAKEPKSIGEHIAPSPDAGVSISKPPDSGMAIANSLGNLDLPVAEQGTDSGRLNSIMGRQGTSPLLSRSPSARSRVTDLAHAERQPIVQTNAASQDSGVLATSGNLGKDDSVDDLSLPSSLIDNQSVVKVTPSATTPVEPLPLIAPSPSTPVSSIVNQVQTAEPEAKDTVSDRSQATEVYPTPIVRSGNPTEAYIDTAIESSSHPTEVYPSQPNKTGTPTEIYIAPAKPTQVASAPPTMVKPPNVSELLPGQVTPEGDISSSDGVDDFSVSPSQFDNMQPAPTGNSKLADSLDANAVSLPGGEAWKQGQLAANLDKNAKKGPGRIESPKQRQRRIAQSPNARSFSDKLTGAFVDSGVHRVGNLFGVPEGVSSVLSEGLQDAIGVGGQRQRGGKRERGGFMESILGDAGGMADILGSSGTNELGGQNSPLLEVMQKLTEAVDALTEAIKAQKGDKVGPDDKGGFTPSFVNGQDKMAAGMNIPNGGEQPGQSPSTGEMLKQAAMVVARLMA